MPNPSESEQLLVAEAETVLLLAEIDRLNVAITKVMNNVNDELNAYLKKLGNA